MSLAVLQRSGLTAQRSYSVAVLQRSGPTDLRSVNGLLPFQYISFFDASYVSTVLVWMMTEVSPRWKYSDWFVIVRVTLQELSPSPAANAVNVASSTEITILRISFLVIFLFV